ncbi:dual specificity protein phosphatase 3-like [Lingula anatina]|uniref:Dual specificity protein phosphatase n=1 Tax=Lingula anatina TaxID=7574 RepID=A0A1S3IFF1_LINAN|nr:dual specificity protein phosphatase 3-like [Lingula anatina]|eukprot:XP_013396995.1 dual specificity protein phosphatase 3-like [Lingula anatina]
MEDEGNDGTYGSVPVTSQAATTSTVVGKPRDFVTQGVTGMESYLHGLTTAKSKSELKRLGITHILNCAKGKSPYHVNTNHVMYRDLGVKFKAIEATDQMNFDLSPYFEETANFIEEAITSGGRIVVHCREGVSRSAAITLAYLMLKKHMTVQQAVRAMRKKREICPNDGFLLQLCYLNDKLLKANHFSDTEQDS